jgi:putative membrane protein
VVGALKDLSPVEREKVAAAVASAQARTQSIFSLAVVPASDRYHLYPIVWGAGLALFVLCGVAVGAPHVGLRMASAIVLTVFLVASLLLEWQPLRMLAVPKRIKHDHARAFAHRQFAVHVLSHPEKKGGVLFFVSLAERYAEIIADHALHQAAGPAAWDKIVGDFTSAAAQGRIADGFVAGVNACGAILETHRPAA